MAMDYEPPRFWTEWVCTDCGQRFATSEACGRHKRAEKERDMKRLADIIAGKAVDFHADEEKTKQNARQTSCNQQEDNEVDSVDKPARHTLPFAWIVLASLILGILGGIYFGGFHGTKTAIVWGLVGAGIVPVVVGVPLQCLFDGIWGHRYKGR